MDSLSNEGRNKSTQTDSLRRYSRRHALKLFGALSAGVIAGAYGRPALPAKSASFALDPNDPRFLPFPGKRKLLQVPDFASQIQASTAVFPPSPFDKPSIYPIAEWSTAHYPNYSASAFVDGRPYVWVATFGGRSITQLDVHSRTTKKFNTGEGTLPLDVAYDSKRKRIVVASADDPATMIVLNLKGEIIMSQSLAALTGKGDSEGGAQGVTIDSNGNYWFALAYHDGGPSGVVAKIDGSTFEVKFVIKDTGLQNPNGIIFAHEGPYILVLSDNGYAHQFNLNGSLQRQLTTIDVGYRGEVHNGQLWVSSWSSKGEMARIDLATEERQVFSCIQLANSVRADHNGRIWVAGDVGLSVSNPDGTLLAMATTTGYANGLTSIDGKVFHANSGSNTDDASDFMTQVALVNLRSLLPSVSSTPLVSS